MAGGITSVGVGSGLDLESLITNMVAAERAPTEQRLVLREAQTLGSISALGSLKGSLTDFQSALGKLKDASAFTARSAVSSDSTLFTATATNSAEVGSHTIQVLQLAKTHKLASENFSDASAKVGTGALAITVGEKSFSVNVEAGVNDTLAGLRDAINYASDNTGVRASLLTVSDGDGGTATKLVFTAKESGEAGAIQISATDADGADGSDLSRLNFPADGGGPMTEASAAQNARITIDGFAVESNTNKFDNAIPGVAITALKEPGVDADPLTGQLTLSENKSGIKSSIEAFVANYNALNTVLNELTKNDPATGKRGLLSGDASIGVMESRIRSVLGSSVEGAAGDFNSLAFLGIATNRDGSISLDGAKLDKALSERYQDVSALFAGDKGIANKMDGVIKELTATGGVFDTRNETLKKQEKEIADQREQLTLRLEKLETRYRKQFSMLDILVAQFNQTGNFLQQQLDASAQIINRDK